MAKYVCDFEQVYSIGEKVVETATTLESSVATYASKIESDLSTWSGIAKDSFSKTNSEQVSVAKEDVTYVKELGEFIKAASQSIQKLEEELATLSI
ncbi:MAG: hypothetical protein J6X28_03415 [Bacilli bacterium]|nr:hypothetical protein [Bacilli bacterium]